MEGKYSQTLPLLKLTSQNKSIKQKHRSFKNLTMQVIVALVYIIYVDAYERKESGIIYMLIWTTGKEMPFKIMQHGREGFIKRNCTYNNCFVTDQREYFKDLRIFDVILFGVKGMKKMNEIPHLRSKNQKYVLVRVNPAAKYVLPANLNKFFNITWSYKLDSDIVFPYLAIKDENKVKIGPKKEMHWLDIEDMKETNLEVKEKLRKKRIAAIMMVSNCKTSNDRLLFAQEIKKELSRNYQRLDIYGDCGDWYCDRKDKECYEIIENNYYFYLAFENSFGEDYVTERVLMGLNHFAVPVVYGTANYTRFMPTGIYLNAYALGAAKVVQKMLDAIYNKEKYYDYFKWHGHYSFHYTGENDFHDEICGLCEFVNNKTVMKNQSVRDINLWWNEPLSPNKLKIQLTKKRHV